MVLFIYSVYFLISVVLTHVDMATAEKKKKPRRRFGDAACPLMRCIWTDNTCTSRKKMDETPVCLRFWFTVNKKAEKHRIILRTAPFTGGGGGDFMSCSDLHLNRMSRTHHPSSGKSAGLPSLTPWFPVHEQNVERRLQMPTAIRFVDLVKNFKFFFY